MEKEREFICTLHSDHSCEHRHYNERVCKLNAKGIFVLATCQYRMEAIIVNVAEEKEESPENVVQQAKVDIA